jgi:hypothetical protein
MNVKIAKDALKRHYRNHVARFGEAAGWSRETRRWRNEIIRPHCGEWVPVDTEFVFDDQFNIDIGPKGARIHARLLDGIRFGMFETLERYERAVQDRYALAWPGATVNTNAVRKIVNRMRPEDPVPELSADELDERNPHIGPPAWIICDMRERESVGRGASHIAALGRARAERYTEGLTWNDIITTPTGGVPDGDGAPVDDGEAVYVLARITDSVSEDDLDAGTFHVVCTETPFPCESTDGRDVCQYVATKHAPHPTGLR